ncbi:MAG TPA: cupredoxin domain-containing protein [Rhizomicrobium sp.]
MTCTQFLAGAALAAFLIVPALADDSTPVAVTLKDHKFTPAEIHVKANAPSEILLTNGDATAEEFDSSSLHVEKVVAGGAKGIVRLRPLAPGRYPFMGEYHSDTAQGVVIAE